jgi:hypothetical protein
MSRSRQACVVLLALFSAAPAAATCGSAQCFLDTGSGEGLQAPHALYVDLSYQWIDQSRKAEGSGGASEVLTPGIDFEEGVIEPDHHREIRTENTLVRLGVTYGVTERLAVFAFLPLVNDRQHEHFDDVGPEETFDDDAGSSGFGDVRVGVRYGLLVQPMNVLTGDLAVKLPTGSYKGRDREGAVQEPTIQPGSGSTDAVARLRWSHPIRPGRLEAFASASYKLNTENSLDYRFGDEQLLIAGMTQRFSSRWSWSLQASARHTGRDEFLGAGVPSTGLLAIDIVPGLAFQGESGLTFSANLEQPVHQDVHEQQLTVRHGLVLGISKSF